MNEVVCVSGVVVSCFHHPPSKVVQVQAMESYVGGTWEQAR